MKRATKAQLRSRLFAAEARATKAEVELEQTRQVLMSLVQKLTITPEEDAWRTAP